MADPLSNVGVGITEPPAPQPEPWVSRDDLRGGALIIAVLAVTGVVLGPVWQAISPRTKGFVLLAHAIVPEENESLVAADGRFVLLTGLVGILAGAVMWMHRSSRGPASATSLALGGLLGAVLTDVVGRAIGGGRATGAVGATVTMQVSVHARGLLLIEPVLALLVYAVGALFAKRDDLSRSAA